MKKTITLLLCTFATSGLMAQGNTSWIAAGIDQAQMRDVPSQSSILRSTGTSLDASIQWKRGLHERYLYRKRGLVRPSEQYRQFPYSRWRMALSCLPDRESGA